MTLPNNNTLSSIRYKNFFFLVSYLFISVSLFSFAPQLTGADDKNDALLNQYIESKGYQKEIVFDSSNIKMFWIDNSVVSENGLIKIYLKDSNGKQFKGVPYKIQLKNIFENYACKVEIITENPDLRFSITDSKKKILSDSSLEEDFLNYNVITAKFNFEEISDDSFCIDFYSDNNRFLSVKKIILSFSINPESSFLVSPGKLDVTKDNTIVTGSVTEGESFVISGKKITIKAKNNIFVADNQFNLSAKVKNAGDTTSTVYIGYIPYSKDRIPLEARYFPYKGNNQLLKVIDCETNSNVIKTESISDWAKNCYVVKMTDPKTNTLKDQVFLNGRIKDVIKNDDGTADIVLDKSNENLSLKKGDYIRINETNGGYVFTNTKTIQPGEEVIINSSIQKDSSINYYSNKFLLKEFYYVKPVIMFYGTTIKDDLSLLVEEFSISY